MEHVIGYLRRLLPWNWPRKQRRHLVWVVIALVLLVLYYNVR